MLSTRNRLTLRPSWLFVTVWPGRFGPFVSAFWARQHTFQRKKQNNILLLTKMHAHMLHNRPAVAVALNQRLTANAARSHRFCMSRITRRSRFYANVYEWLILQLLPLLKVRMLVCKTTISLFTDLFAWLRGSFYCCIIYIKYNNKARERAV